MWAPYKKFFGGYMPAVILFISKYLSIRIFAKCKLFELSLVKEVYVYVQSLTRTTQLINYRDQF